MHGLIRQRAGAGDDADGTLLVNVAGHDADLGLAGGDDAGAVRPDETRLRVLQLGPHLDHVQRGNALGDGDDQRNARVLGFENGVGGKRRRDKDHGRVGSGLLHGVLNRIEDGPAFVGCAALAGSYATNDLGAVFSATHRVKGAFFAGNALNDESSVLIYQDRHLMPPHLRLPLQLAQPPLSSFRPPGSSAPTL